MSKRSHKSALRGSTSEPFLAPAESTLEYPGLVGSSPAMRALFDSIDKVSRYKTNVLLLGESGTGKELVARLLHARGPRRGQLFVPLNCATLGRELLENELFGHERGAFTSANEKKQGLFELADEGTLFLDEIGEMDPATQAKLLRVLERNEFRRVGGTNKVKVDLSVIAATNQNLEKAVHTGAFRSDLYYRLKVVTLSIPPLRERREDIPALIAYFVADFNRRNNQQVRGVSPQALKMMLDHDWHGNVRELKHAVESAAVFATGETIGAEGFIGLNAYANANRVSAHHDSKDGASIDVRLGETFDNIEKNVILAYLRHYRTKTKAAQALGIGVRTLYTKLKKYGPPDSLEEGV